ncbi:TNFAIP8 [Cordylochernes scorpioides]|nr:TNFAIP8 [Cordylochernes scorpioides]
MMLKSDDVGDFNFKAKDVAIRAQKKLLSRMSNKSMAKMFIDDNASNLLDNFYRLARTYSPNKKEAEKIIKNIIKIVVKIGLLYRNDQLSAAEIALAEKFQKKFHRAAVTFSSFVEVEFSYERDFLAGMLKECQGLLRELVARHLTDKSLSRIDHVFNYFTNPTFLDTVFLSKDPSSPYCDLLKKIVKDLHLLMDDGAL